MTIKKNWLKSSYSRPKCTEEMKSLHHTVLYATGFSRIEFYPLVKAVFHALLWDLKLNTQTYVTACMFISKCMCIHLRYKKHPYLCLDEFEQTFVCIHTLIHTCVFWSIKGHTRLYRGYTPWHTSIHNHKKKQIHMYKMVPKRLLRGLVKDE